MTITRSNVLLLLAAGWFSSGWNVTAASAQTSSEHAHSASQDAHAPNAMMAEKEISKALATLTDADRKQAVAQRFCPIMEYSRLGADGTPHKVMIGGTPVFVCCKGCIEDAEAGGKATLAKGRKLAKVSAALAKMPAQERAAAEAQKYCAVANKNFLGSMGAPIKLEVSGKPVYLCCKGCLKKANADPAGVLAKAEALRKAGEKGDHDHKGSDSKGHGHGDHKH